MQMFCYGKYSDGTDTYPAYGNLNTVPTLNVYGVS